MGHPIIGGDGWSVSSQRAASSASTQRVQTGNPGERSRETCGLFSTLIQVHLVSYAHQTWSLAERRRNTKFPSKRNRENKPEHATPQGTHTDLKWRPETYLSRAASSALRRISSICCWNSGLRNTSAAFAIRRCASSILALNSGSSRITLAVAICR
jgi:hypothetical protein